MAGVAKIAWRRWRNRIVLGLGSVAVAVVLGEVAVRVSASWLYPRAQIRHPTLGWAHPPSVRRAFVSPEGEDRLFVTNRWGHVGGDGTGAATPGRARVLFLGDSFTEGVQVGTANVFTERLARACPELAVINAGVAGYGTVQQLIYLRDQGLDFAPDLVVLVVCANDLTDNLMPWAPRLGARPHARASRDGMGEGASVSASDIELVEQFSDEPYLRFCLPVPGRGFLYRHSQLYRSLNEKVWQRLRRDHLRDLEMRLRPRISHELQERVITLLLDRMAALLRDREIGFAVVLIPRREDVRGENGLGGDGGRPQHAALATHCVARGVPVVDLREAMVAARAAGERVYFDNDMHWTAAGHAVAAREIEALVRRLL